MAKRFGLLVLSIAALAAADAAADAPRAGVVPAPTSAPSYPTRARPALVHRIGDAQGGTVAVVRWAGATLALVADEDDQTLHVLDIDAGVERGVTPLGGAPSQLLVLDDG